MRQKKNRIFKKQELRRSSGHGMNPMEKLYWVVPNEKNLNH